jgi:hypothetical protein
MLSCRSNHAQAVKRGRSARLQSLDLPGESVLPEAETSDSRCPPGVLPSKALSVPGVGPGSHNTELAPSEAPRPLLPCTSPCGGCFGVLPTGNNGFPPCGGAGLSGVCHLVTDRHFRTHPSFGDRFSRTARTQRWIQEAGCPVSALQGVYRGSGCPDPPLRTGRPRGRRTDPHGVERVFRGSGTESSALLVRRSRQTVSAAFRCSLPCREPQTVARDLASLNLACPFRVRQRIDAGLSAGHHPRGLRAPSALTEPRVRSFAGAPSPPPSVLSVFHALDGLHPAIPFRACFIPVTLMGFRLQGVSPRRGAVPLSRPYALLPFEPHPSGEARVQRAASEPCSPRRVRTAEGRNPKQPLPSWRSPL